MCKDCWFTKYNKVLLHYSVSIAAAAAAYIHLSAAVAAYIPLSAAAAAAAAAGVAVVVMDTHHSSVDTDELFHAYFFYVSSRKFHFTLWTCCRHLVKHVFPVLT